MRGWLGCLIGGASTRCLRLAKPFDVNDIRRAVQRVLEAAA